jgi:hypothetical protein
MINTTISLAMQQNLYYSCFNIVGNFLEHVDADADASLVLTAQSVALGSIAASVYGAIIEKLQVEASATNLIFIEKIGIGIGCGTVAIPLALKGIKSIIPSSLVPIVETMEKIHFSVIKIANLVFSTIALSRLIHHKTPLKTCLTLINMASASLSAYRLTQVFQYKS